MAPPLTAQTSAPCMQAHTATDGHIDKTYRWTNGRINAPAIVLARQRSTSGLAAESRKVQQCQINRITVVVVKRLVQPMSVFCDSSLNRGNPLAWDCLYTHVYGCTHVHTHMLHARLNLKLREQIDRACSHIFPLENHTRVMAPRIPVPGRVDTTQC